MSDTKTVDSTENITQLLARARAGDRESLSQVASVVYAQLRQLAAARLSAERSDHTLQPTALVNEAFVRLMRTGSSYEDRKHFFAAASSVMRNVLVDYARARKAARRDAGVRVELTAVKAAYYIDLDSIVLLDSALQKLAKLNDRHAKVVEMYFFGGMTYSDIAEVLGISPRTAKRDWELARPWLQSHMKGLRHDSG